MKDDDKRLAAAMPSGTVSSWWAPVLLLILGFWLVPLSHTCQLKCVPGDLGDARFNGVVLEHFYAWLMGRQESLISPDFFYPMPGVITFSDNHWGTAWIYSIFRFFGGDRYEAFDLWYLMGYLANFIACHLVFRRLRFSSLASALGAFAFTFAMPVVAQHGHAQLDYRFLIPVGLLMWERFNESGRWRWLALVALVIVAQFYVSIYLGYFALLLLAGWAALQWALMGGGARVWFAQWRHSSGRVEVAVSVLVMLVAGAAFVLLMQPYLHYSKLYGFQRAVEEVSTMLPRPQSYFLADASAIWGRSSAQIAPSLPMRHEHQMFFGVGILGLALVGLTRSRLRMRFVAALALVALVVLTINISGHSLYLLLVKMPGLGSIRAVSRIGIVMLLPLALLVAMAVDAPRRTGDSWRPLVFALAGLMVAEASMIKTSNFGIDAVRQRMAVLRGEVPDVLQRDAVLFNPMRNDQAPIDTELDGVILAQDANRPTLNGYSGNLPSGYEPQSGANACVQAGSRLRAAEGFFNGRLGGDMPFPVSGPVQIVGGQACPPKFWMEMPLSDASKLILKVNAVEREGSQVHLHVTVTNGSSALLQTLPRQSHPLRLSWQVVASGAKVDPSAWVARVGLEEGGEISPGQSRNVSFSLPAPSIGHSRVVVSAVLEGRAWLHEYGLVPAAVELEPSRAVQQEVAY